MSLKRLVGDKALWDSFLEEIEGQIKQAQKTLEQVTDVPQMHQAQGKIMALRNLKYLKDKFDG